MKRHLGFTLIELFIVMAIMATAAMLLVPTLSSGGTARLEAQARELIAVLNNARQMAIIQGMPQTVKMAKGGDDVHQAGRVAAGKWESQGAEIRWANYAMGEDTKGLLQVTFFPEGGSTGGTVLISDKELNAKVKIDSITGKVSYDFVSVAEEERLSKKLKD